MRLESAPNFNQQNPAVSCPCWLTEKRSRRATGRWRRPSTDHPVVGTPACPIPTGLRQWRVQQEAHRCRRALSAAGSRCVHPRRARSRWRLRPTRFPQHRVSRFGRGRAGRHSKAPSIRTPRRMGKGTGYRARHSLHRSRGQTAYRHGRTRDTGAFGRCRVVIHSGCRALGSPPLRCLFSGTLLWVGRVSLHRSSQNKRAYRAIGRRDSFFRPRIGQRRVCSYTSLYSSGTIKPFQGQKQYKTNEFEKRSSNAKPEARRCGTVRGSEWFSVRHYRGCRGRVSQCDCKNDSEAAKFACQRRSHRKTRDRREFYRLVRRRLIFGFCSCLFAFIGQPVDLRRSNQSHIQETLFSKVIEPVPSLLSTDFHIVDDIRCCGKPLRTQFYKSEDFHITVCRFWTRHCLFYQSPPAKIILVLIYSDLGSVPALELIGMGYRGVTMQPLPRRELRRKHPERVVARRGMLHNSIMTENANPQKTDVEGVRDTFLAQFDTDPKRHREAKARTSVLQTTFHPLARRAWGGEQ